MAKGRWLRRQGRRIASFADETVDSVVDAIEDKISDGDLGPMLQSINQVGIDCARLSRETSTLCATTEEKGTKMMELGNDLKETLSTFSNGNMDASALETVRDLIDGDHVHEAKTLAKEISEKAVSCVKASVEMLNLMEDTLDKLPPVVQKALDDAFDDNDDDDAEEADDEEEGEGDGAVVVNERSMDQDIEDVTECITSVKEINLVSAMEVGLRVFSQLSTKASRSTDLFASIRTFSDDVFELARGFKKLNLRTFMKFVKDLWKCLRYAAQMKVIAAAVGRLMGKVIDLFRESSERLSGLWSALAFCKECITECGEHVIEARDYVLTAQADALALVEKTRSIQDNVDSFSDIENPRDAKRALVTLAKSGTKDMKTAIDIAQRMDDQVALCVRKTVGMVDKVSEGYRNLPPIVTEGIADDEGESEEDAKPPDIAPDIEELTKAREEIDSARFLDAAKASARGMRGVAKKAINCQDMLDIVQAFVKQSMATVEAFMGVWDLPSAMIKIQEMCRLVNLGKLMKQFAAEVKELLLAMIAILKAAVDKLGDVFSDFADHIEDKFDDVKDKAKEKLEKLQFWK